MNREEKEYLEDVTQQVREIREVIDKDHALLAKQLKPTPSIPQRILQWVLNVFGTLYVLIEQFVEYPDDDVISMGGTFDRLVSQGNIVNVAYQTSGNIAGFCEYRKYCDCYRT